MRVRFAKMQAQGNDFVILDGRQQALPELSEETIRHLADRRLGVGCDQVLVLTSDDHADARMRIYNPDGSTAGNCGNGLRSAGWLLLRDADRDEVRIALPDRVVTVRQVAAGMQVQMGAARIVEANGRHVDVEIGNPHRVFFEAVEDFPTDRNIEIVTGRVGPNAYIDIIERGVGRIKRVLRTQCRGSELLLLKRKRREHNAERKHHRHKNHRDEQRKPAPSFASLRAMPSRHALFHTIANPLGRRSCLRGRRYRLWSTKPSRPLARPARSLSRHCRPSQCV